MNEIRGRDGARASYDKRVCLESSGVGTAKQVPALFPNYPGRSGSLRRVLVRRRIYQAHSYLVSAYSSKPVASKKGSQH
jgi:hypothetical protein